jgi:hypothetical protein
MLIYFIKDEYYFLVLLYLASINGLSVAIIVSKKTKVLKGKYKKIRLWSEYDVGNMMGVLSILLLISAGLLKDLLPWYIGLFYNIFVLYVISGVIDLAFKAKGTIAMRDVLNYCCKS